LANVVTTPIGVINFPNLFEPRGNSQNAAQEARYSAMLLLDGTGTGSTAYSELRKAVMDAITEKFGGAKAADPAFIRSLRLPFRNASEKEYAGFEDGEIFISAWKSGKQDAPGVVDLGNAPVLVPGDVFSGQLARFTVRPFAYDNNGNKGVSLGLEHVQIVKADMPRLDNRQSADKAFAGNTDDEQLKALGLTATTSAPSGPADGSGDAFPF